MQVQVQVPGPGGKHCPPECQRQRRARIILESASASHRGAPTNLLDESEFHGGFCCKGQPRAGAGACAWSSRPRLADDNNYLEAFDGLSPASMAVAAGCRSSLGFWPAIDHHTCRLPQHRGHRGRERQGKGQGGHPAEQALPHLRLQGP